MKGISSRGRLLRGYTLLWAAVALSGCATQEGAVRTRFQSEYNCSDSTVRSMGASTYHVRGCGHSVTYVCTGGDVYGGWGQQTKITCVKESSSASRRPVGVRGAGQTVSAPQAAARKTPMSDGSTRIEAVFNMRVGARSAQVFLRGNPVGDRELTWLGIRVYSRQREHKACETRMVANGKRVELPAAEYKFAQGAEEFRFRMPLASLVEIGSGQRVIGRICQDEFQLTKEALDTIKKFLVFFEEELALHAESPETEDEQPGPTEL